MIPTLAATLVLAPTVPDGQWGPTTMSPRAIAKLVDNRLATLPRARLQFQYSYSRKAVGDGRMLCRSAIARPGVFRLELPNVDEARKFVLETDVWISDGKRFAVKMNGEPTAAMAIPRPATPLRPVKNWFVDFTRTIFSGLGRTTHPFANFVEDANRSGFKVSTNLRQIRAYGRIFKQYRLVAAKGDARYETVVDARFGVPTSIVNTIGASDNTRWSAVRWEFPKTPLAPSETAFRRPERAPRSAPAPLRRKASPSR